MPNPNDKKGSSALQRHVQAYPPPKYFLLVEAMSTCNEISRSEVVNTALKDYFDRMPQGERERMIAVSKSKNQY